MSRAQPANSASLARSSIRARGPLGTALPFEAGYAALTGLLLAIALIKWGNPVIFEHIIASPEGWAEFIFTTWPLQWAYVALGIYAAATAALIASRAWRGEAISPRTPLGLKQWRGLVWLPLLWLAWQYLAAFSSVDPGLTRQVLFHFTGCVMLFYAGYLALSRVRQLRIMWLMVLAGFAYMLWVGFDQRYGGLEAVREMVYALPDWQALAPEYLQRISSERIFATLVYPNALAGALLLLAPPMLVVAWQVTTAWPRVGRGLAVGLLGYAAVACLVWSGSKGGWLIALVLCAAVFLAQPVNGKVKAGLVVILLAMGLTGFAVRYAGYFQKGATSVVARLDYWRAVGLTVRAHPVFGSGPGTFGVSYAKVKAPESEMARLAHNDYLQQASDSGMIGFLSYLAFISGSIICLYRKSFRNPLRFALWLGLLAWALQAMAEFSLFIPALAWPAFLWMGYLWGCTPAESEITRGAEQEF